MCRHEACSARSSLSFAVHELDNEGRQNGPLLAMRYLLDRAVGDTANRPCLIWFGIVLGFEYGYAILVVGRSSGRMCILLFARAHNARGCDELRVAGAVVLFARGSGSSTDNNVAGLPNSPIENLAPIWRDHQRPFEAIHAAGGKEEIPGQDGRVDGGQWQFMVSCLGQKNRGRKPHAPRRLPSFFSALLPSAGSRVSVSGCRRGFLRSKS